MAEHDKQSFSIVPEMSAFAEQSVTQARKAFDGFMAAAQGAVSTLESQAAATQAGAKDLQRKAVAFAEENVAASFDFVQKLLAAKDTGEIMTLHAEHVKAQLQALGEQTRELGQTAAKAAAARSKN